MAETMIEVDTVAKRFGSTEALAGVSLAVERGKVPALLGPHGAGKTTLVRILTTLLQPDRGLPGSLATTSSQTPPSCPR